MAKRYIFDANKYLEWYEKAFRGDNSWYDDSWYDNSWYDDSWCHKCDGVEVTDDGELGDTGFVIAGKAKDAWCRVVEDDEFPEEDKK